MNCETDDKECWLLSLQTDFISSEESDIDEDGKPIYCIKPLSWRREIVNDFFSLLDEEHKKGLSPQAVQQSRRRVTLDVPSTRSKRVGDYPLGFFAEEPPEMNVNKLN